MDCKMLAVLGHCWQWKLKHCLYSLVEQYPGAHNELEDVFQGFHGFEELISDPTLLSIVHVCF